ncbi:metallophosphoesterase [Inhella sp.]|uniref:metallophosphoesterase family protein n=1 Tax=Inhella sp. TaxID=1921806 RepID=UPI0035AE8A3C
MTPGRSCPLDYRTTPQEMARTPAPEGLRGLETLYVVGGLYGNLEALEALLSAFAAEPAARKALVFNGDFHWFDAEVDWFSEVQQRVLAHWATRGNVETEVAREQIGDAGCGCAYPDWVGDGTVDFSNRIIERLHAVLSPAQRQQLAALPAFLRAEVDGLPVGIVHGDADSLAGWGFCQEAMREAPMRAGARQACDAAGVQLFASSHSCLPVLQALGEGRWLANNGAAGMPNVQGNPCGLFTRVATTPAPRALAQVPLNAVGAGSPLHLALCPIAFDFAAWRRRFDTRWPPGSDAERSYGQRIRLGPAYQVGQVLRQR